MDEAELMDSNIIKLMFENGVSHSLSLFILFCIHEKKFMGLETESDYGGAECSFTAAILAVEGMWNIIFYSNLTANPYSPLFLNIELAKVDPSISALCDIHVNEKNRE